MRRIVAIAVLAMVALTSFPPRASADAALDSLIATERAFAALSLAKGMREAFLAYLTEDAIVFQPHAMNGRAFWQARGPSAATLKWEPAFGAVSSAGDMGYTCGPWVLQPPPDSSGTPADPGRYLHGHFNSVWKKDKKAGWRVVADIGVTHGKPERGGVGSGDFTAGPILPIRTMKSSRVNLQDLDRKLSKDMRSKPPREALVAHAALDVRFNTEGRMPAVGIDAAQAMLDTLIGFYAFSPQGSQVSRSGDLGFTYGVAERFVSANAAAADTSVYLHVWREDGRAWRLALAVVNPLKRR